MKAPLVTIAIPVYQRVGMIDAALESVVSQLVPGVDVLVLDNCSTDGTYERALQWAGPQVRIERNDRNIGMGMNFLRCIELAHGAWFRFLMSDDRLLPGAVKVMVELIENHPEIDLQFSAGTMDPDMVPSREELESSIRIEAIDGYNRDQRRWRYHDYPAMPNAYCLKRSTLLPMVSDPNFLDLYRPLAASGHCIDYLILAYNAAQAQTIAYVSAPTYYLRAHAGQGSARYKTNMQLHLTGDYVVVSRIWKPTRIEKFWFYPHALRVILDTLRRVRAAGPLKWGEVLLRSASALIWIGLFHAGMIRESIRGTK